MTGVDLLGFATSPWDGPDGLLDAHRVARGIRKLTRGAFAAAARVNQCISVGGKRERRDFLAVVFEIGREATGFEVRTFGDPDIALALFVERPCDTIAGFRRSQIRRKWSAHNLLEREALLRLCMSTRNGEQNQKWNCYERTLHLLLLRGRNNSRKIGFSLRVAAGRRFESRPSALRAVH